MLVSVAMVKNGTTGTNGITETKETEEQISVAEFVEFPKGIGWHGGDCFEFRKQFFGISKTSL